MLFSENHPENYDASWKVVQGLIYTVHFKSDFIQSKFKGQFKYNKFKPLFQASVSFLYPLKTRDFPMFLGGIEAKH